MVSTCLCAASPGTSRTVPDKLLLTLWLYRWRLCPGGSLRRRPLLLGHPGCRHRHHRCGLPPLPWYVLVLRIRIPVYARSCRHRAHSHHAIEARWGKCIEDAWAALNWVSVSRTDRPPPMTCWCSVLTAPSPRRLRPATRPRPSISTPTPSPSAASRRADTSAWPCST